MQFIKKIFGIRPIPANDDLTMVAKEIGPLLDNGAFEVFSKYSKILLAEDATYIVPAVWGAKKDGELDEIQIEIHQIVAPMVIQAYSYLQLQKVAPAQEFAIKYLVRGYIITKIAHLTEMLKKESCRELSSTVCNDSPLKHLKTIGRA